MRTGKDICPRRSSQFKVPFACLGFSKSYQSYLWDNQVTVVQRGSVELHENLALTDSWDRCVFENKAVEIIVLVLDNPLLHS